MDRDIAETRAARQWLPIDEFCGRIGWSRERVLSYVQRRIWTEGVFWRRGENELMLSLVAFHEWMHG